MIIPMLSPMRRRASTASRTAASAATAPEDELMHAMTAALNNGDEDEARLVWQAVRNAQESDGEFLAAFATHGGAGALFNYVASQPLDARSADAESLTAFAWAALAEIALHESAARKVSDVKTLLFNMTLVRCCVQCIPSRNGAAALRVLRALASNHLEFKHKLLTYPRLVDAVLASDDAEAWLTLDVLSAPAPFAPMQRELYRVMWKHSALVERVFAASKTPDAEVRKAALAVLHNLLCNAAVLDDVRADESLFARVQKCARRGLSSGLAPVAVGVLQCVCPDGRALEQATLEAMREALATQSTAAAPVAVLLCHWAEWDANKTRLVSVAGMLDTLRDVLAAERTPDAFEADRPLLEAVLELLQHLGMAPGGDGARALFDTPALMRLVVDRIAECPLQAVSCVLYALKAHADGKKAVVDAGITEQLAALATLRANNNNNLHRGNAALVKARVALLEQELGPR